MVVIQEPHVRRLLEVRISQAGHRAVWCTQVAELESLPEQQAPDLILIDTELPPTARYRSRPPNRQGISSPAYRFFSSAGLQNPDLKALLASP